MTFAALIARPHLALSATRKSLNCSGVLPTGSTPSCTSLLEISGIASTFAISFCTRAMAAGGVPFAAQMPLYALTIAAPASVRLQKNAHRSHEKMLPPNDSLTKPRR